MTGRAGEKRIQNTIISNIMNNCVLTPNIMATLTTREHLQAVADSIASICCEVSIREDENGPLVLAFGLNDTHSIELRKVGDNFVLELWQGRSAEEKIVVDKLVLSSIDDARRAAQGWLLKDAEENGSEHNSF